MSTRLLEIREERRALHARLVALDQEEEEILTRVVRTKKPVNTQPKQDSSAGGIDGTEKMHYNIINMKGGDSDCPQKTKPYKSD